MADEVVLWNDGALVATPRGHHTYWSERHPFDRSSQLYVTNAGELHAEGGLAASLRRLDG